MLDSKEPSFLADNQSVVSLVTQLHSYFKNSYSHFEIEHSKILSKTESLDDKKKEELLEKLRKVEQEIFLLGVLNDAFSIADKVLHATTAMNDLGLNSGIYKVHHEAKNSNSLTQ